MSINYENKTTFNSLYILRERSQYVCTLLSIQNWHCQINLALFVYDMVSNIIAILMVAQIQLRAPMTLVHACVTRVHVCVCVQEKAEWQAGTGREPASSRKQPLADRGTCGSNSNRTATGVTDTRKHTHTYVGDTMCVCVRVSTVRTIGDDTARPVGTQQPVDIQ